MEMILNDVQKEFLLMTWFDDYDRDKIFGTAFVDEIAEREIKLVGVGSPGWPKVFVDGEEVTSINPYVLTEEMRRLIALSDE